MFSPSPLFLFPPSSDHVPALLTRLDERLSHLSNASRCNSILHSFLLRALHALRQETVGAAKCVADEDDAEDELNLAFLQQIGHLEAVLLRGSDCSPSWGGHSHRLYLSTECLLQLATVVLAASAGARPRTLALGFATIYASVLHADQSMDQLLDSAVQAIKTSVRAERALLRHLRQKTASNDVQGLIAFVSVSTQDMSDTFPPTVASSVRLVRTLNDGSYLFAGPTASIDELHRSLLLDSPSRSSPAAPFRPPRRTPLSAVDRINPDGRQAFLDALQTHADVGLSDVLLSSTPDDKRDLSNALADLRARTEAGAPASVTILPSLASTEEDERMLDAVRSAWVQIGGKPSLLDVRVDAPSIGTPRPPTLSCLGQSENEQVAVIGMSCRVPGADDLDEAWALLERGRNMCTEIPPHLFDVHDYWRTDAKGRRERNSMRAHTMNAFSESQVKTFDRHVFGIADRETVRQMDPQQRLALMCAHEAFEYAAYVPETRGHQIGCFVGVSSDDYQEHGGRDGERPEKMHPYHFLGTHRPLISNRISDFFGLTGPSITLDTACSSSLVAIESACRSIARRECTAALAGGVNVLTQPQIFVGLDRGFFLSPTGQCKFMDRTADGYSRADAIGFVLLKRLSDASRDGDRILGVITAAATNHSGNSVSITHPDARTQAELCTSIVSECGLRPEQVDVAECHGTGTQAGDKVELTAVKNALRPQAAALPTSLVIGSVKANVGHSESASGAIALVKALLMLERESVPVHIGISTTMNPQLPSLDGLSLAPPGGAPFPRRTEGPRTVYVANFSAAGGNTCLVLRDAPQAKRPVSVVHTSGGDGKRSRPVVIALSAGTPTALSELRRRYSAFLARGGEEGTGAEAARLREFCYVATAGRTHRRQLYRAAAVVNDMNDLRKFLEPGDPPRAPAISPTSPRSVWVFSGQGGSPFQASTKTLFRVCKPFRCHLKHCHRLAVAWGFEPFLSFFHGEDAANGGKAISPSPEQEQLAIFSVQASLFGLLKRWGMQPSAVIGHSLGEYAALFVAGVMSLESALRLVGSKARLAAQLCRPGETGMVALDAGQEVVRMLLTEAKCEDVCQVACVNSPKDTVVSGPIDDVRRLADYVKNASTTNAQGPRRATVLPVPFGFHSSAVHPMLEPFSEVVRTVKFRPPNLPVAANVGGKVVGLEDGVIDADYLVRQSAETVAFEPGVSNLLRLAGPDAMWLEVGPTALLAPMVVETLKKGTGNISKDSSSSFTPTCTPCLRKGVDPSRSVLDLLGAAYLHGADLDWGRVYEDFGSKPRHLLAGVPTYPFDVKGSDAAYWIEYADRNLRDHLASSDSARKDDPQPAQHLPRPRGSLLDVCLCASRTGDLVEATFETKTNRSPCKEIIMGHKVGGAGLLPATMVSELAFEVANYLQDGGKDDDGTCPAFEVKDVAISHPLTRHDDQNGDQVIIVTAKGSLAKDGSGLVISLASRGTDQDGRFHEREHGTCVVVPQEAGGRRSLDDLWKHMRPLVTTRAEILRERSDDVIKADLGYELFESVVTYERFYQGMQSVYFSENGHEAVSDVRLSLEAPAGDFVVNPVIQDSLGQLSGFIPNVSLAGQGEVYIANGLASVRFDVEKISAATTRKGPGVPLHAYCAMYPLPGSNGGVVCGDAYFFEAGTGDLVGMMEGVQFRRMKETVFRALFPSPRITGAQSKSAFTKADDSSNEATSSPTTTVVGSDPSSPRNCQNALPPTFYKLGPELDQRLHNTQTVSPCGESHVKDRRPSLVSLRRSSSLRSDVGRAPLFLLADGSGSAGALNELAEFDLGAARVYALDSPFLEEPERWAEGVSQAAFSYLDQILAQEPRGPYRLGGWSAGGLMALEVCRLLTEMGETVEALYIIDSPPPALLPGRRAPRDIFQHFFNNRDIPAYQKRHFIFCAQALRDHISKPLRPRSLLTGSTRSAAKTDRIAMQVVIIEATRRVGHGADLPVSLRSLEAWQKLFRSGDEELESDFVVRRIAVDADHFSLMKKPAVRRVAEVLCA